jgi:hypothetical protein
MIQVFGSIRAIPRALPDASSPHIHFVNRDGEFAWIPPFDNLLRVGPRVPNHFARRIKDTRENDLPTGCDRAVMTLDSFGVSAN